MSKSVETVHVNKNGKGMVINKSDLGKPGYEECELQSDYLARIEAEEAEKAEDDKKAKAEKSPKAKKAKAEKAK